MIKLFEDFNKEPEIDIEYYDNGQKKKEEWWLITNRNVIRHRENGPAFQMWHKNGHKFSEHWWLNGKKYTREEWINKLKEIGSEHYEEQKMIYDAEKYNL